MRQTLRQRVTTFSKGAGSWKLLRRRIENLLDITHGRAIRDFFVKARTYNSKRTFEMYVGGASSDAAVVDQVSMFYELQVARARLGTALTQEDIRNLKVVLVAVGSGTRTLIDFLIVKFANRELRR